MGNVNTLAILVVAWVLAVPVIELVYRRGIRRGRQIERYARDHIITGDFS